MFFKIFKTVLTPVISTSLLMIGCGFINTVINLRINDESYYSSFLVGILTSTYYLGMLLGAFKTSAMIFKVGHIRAYSAFASAFAISILVPALSDNIYLLTLMRILSGYCIGALFVTIESWLLTNSGAENRGKFLSFYMISLYGGNSLGQLLLHYINYNSVYPFCVAAIFTALSVIPVSIANSKPSQYEKSEPLNLIELFKISPTGVVGCFISGMINSSIYGLVPVYYDDLHYSEVKIGNFMAATILGGMLLQYPLGLLSDRYDRRKVLLTLCSLSILSATIFILQNYLSITQDILVVCLLFIFGGISFAIYPISMSHACDLLKYEHLVEATQALLLAYGVGSIIGPLSSSVVMKYVGPLGLFISFNIYSLILIIFFTYRIFVGSRPKPQEEYNFVAVPTTTPVTTELDPRSN